MILDSSSFLGYPVDIVECCRLKKLNGDLSRLHSADDGKRWKNPNKMEEDCRLKTVFSLWPTCLHSVEELSRRMRL